MSAFLLHFILLVVNADTLWGMPLQDEKIYTVSEVNVAPQPVKGQNDFQRQWSNNVKYPKEALRRKVQGVVFIEFVVGKDGTILEPAIKSGFSDDCDEAALKGFTKVSKDAWKPGVKNGEAVKVKMVLPFVFRIVDR